MVRQEDQLPLNYSPFEVARFMRPNTCYYALKYVIHTYIYIKTYLCILSNLILDSKKCLIRFDLIHHSFNSFSFEMNHLPFPNLHELI